MEPRSKVITPDTGPDAKPPKPDKPKQSWLELFAKPKGPEQAKRYGSAEQPAKLDREKPPVQGTGEDRGKDLKPERRKFAANLASFLRRQPPDVPAEGHKERPAPAKLEAQPAAAEQSSEPQTVIERAKAMGHNVLGLIRRVRNDVEAADTREAVPIPTNIQPLAEADADVRAAVQELIAPIVAHEAEPPELKAQPAHPSQETLHPPGDLAVPEFVPPEATPRESASAASTESGYGGEPGTDYLHAARTAAEAPVAATGAGLDIIQGAKEKIKRPAVSAARSVGLLALGAATAVGFAYTWHKMRTLRKEQRATQKQLKRLESEVREHQEAEESRLRQLEQTPVARMNQSQRQEFVQEVSRFAHHQAQEIRGVTSQAEHYARPVQTAAAERIQQPDQAAAEQPRRPQQSQRQPERPPASVLAAPEGQGAESPPQAERPERRVAASPEVVPHTREQGLVERLKETVSARKDRTKQEGAGVSLLAGIFGDNHAQTNRNRAVHPPGQPLPKPRKPLGANVWLLYGLLAIGAVVLMLLLT